LAIGPFTKVLPPFPDAVSAPAPQHLGRFIAAYLRPAWLLLALLLVLSLAAAVVEAGLMRSIGASVDGLERSGAGEIPRGLFLVGAALIIATPTLRACSGIISSYILAPNLEARTIWQAHQSALSARLSEVQASLPGRIAGRVAEAGASIRALAVQALDSIAYGIAYGAAMVALMASMSAAFAAPLLVWFLIYGVLVARFIPRASMAGAAAAAAHSAMVGQLADSYANITNVKLFDGLPAERAVARVFVGRRLSTLFRAETLLTRYDIAIAALNASLLLAVAALGATYWRAGTLSVGDATAAITLSLRLAAMAGWFLNSAAGVFQTLGLLRDAMASVALEPEEETPPRLSPIRLSKGEIRFDALKLFRPSDGAILGPFDMTVAPGTQLGLSGPSGCGKSTMIGTILRFQTPLDGRILLDGQDISRHSIASIRQQIAVAPQHVRLFHRTIRENIAYGCTDASEQMIDEVIDLSGLRALADGARAGASCLGLDDDIGEDGAKLSGGERQRVSIARALLKANSRRCPVLILDEATSALDAVSEAAILDGMVTLSGRPTIIMVSHRPATLDRVDQVLAVG
jgi:ATP-binding cassette subfamily B multidrug efflux pump